MIRELTYNNRILSEQERVEFCEKSDEYINMFSECIEEICQLATKIQESENSDYDKITNTLILTSTFTGYSFCDCIVLTKLFVRATNPYEKSFLRGKLKVQLNESFKKLITMFPGFKSEFDELLSDLEQISKNSWWKDERDAEVHINATKLYKLRHEEINESKIAMETVQLTDLFNRFNHLISEVHRTLLNHMVVRYVKENGIRNAI